MRQGLTQREVARRARLTQAYIAEMESGRKRNPSVAALARIARALSVPLIKLVK